MHSNNEVLTTQQMAEADRITVIGDAIASNGMPIPAISARQLMENAGHAVVHAIEQRWQPCPVVVLCGPGNNGGDGFVVARLLAQNSWPVRVALFGDKDRLRDEARHHAEQWQGEVEVISPAVLGDAQLVVDALFGAGFKAEIPAIVADTLHAAASQRLPIVAVDIPSGLGGNNGADAGAVPCAVTVTFFRKKPGHLLYPGRQLCGEVIVADIGIHSSVLANIAVNTFENSSALWQRLFPLPNQNSHKYTRGHALIYGGYPMTGASRLAARAAARIGAGLVSIAVAESAFPVYAAALTSIMVHPISAQADFDKLLNDKRINALLIGPGAGAGNQEMQDKTLDRASAMLASGKACVLDADAITAFQGKVGLLRQAVKGPCVITPHEGEFNRLFADIDTVLDKLSRARLAATASNSVIVLKGADTVIASPDGRAAINSNAPPYLATGGSGDVLSGIILGLLTQGMPAYEAACAGVWMHGAAATKFGIGLIAEDIPEKLPQVIYKLFRS